MYGTLYFTLHCVRTVPYTILCPYTRENTFLSVNSLLLLTNVLEVYYTLHFILYCKSSCTNMSMLLLNVLRNNTILASSTIYCKLYCTLNYKLKFTRYCIIYFIVYKTLLYTLYCPLCCTPACLMYIVLSN